MREVTQTKFSIFKSNGERITYGNCLVACLASILEEPIEEIPNIYTFYGVEPEYISIEKRNGQPIPLWLYVLNVWLENKHKRRLVKRTSEELEHGYTITRGKSFRNLPHCVVGSCNKDYGTNRMEWDPHPSREGLKSVDYYYQIVRI
jgi:hypothetical protein